MTPRWNDVKCTRGRMRWPLINRTGNKVLAIKESTLLKRRLLILGTNCATYSTRQRTQKSLNATNNRKEACARRTEQRTTTVTTNTSRKKPVTVVSNESNCKVTVAGFFLLKIRLPQKQDLTKTQFFALDKNSFFGGCWNWNFFVLTQF